jgi:hypothetical protein
MSAGNLISNAIVLDDLSHRRPIGKWTGYEEIEQNLCENIISYEDMRLSKEIRSEKSNTTNRTIRKMEFRGDPEVTDKSTNG